MSKLYQLAGQYLQLTERANDPDVPEQAFLDTLDALTGDIEAKAESLSQVMAGIKSDCEAIDREISRLQHRKAVLVNREKSLKDYLRFNMEATGINKITCPLFSITLAQPKPMVAIVDESLIPNEYIVTTTSSRPDKVNILKRLKDGEDIPGCKLTESARGLSIR